MAASLGVAGGSAQADTSAIPICPTADELSVSELPASLNVRTCDVEDLVVTYDGTGIEMPEPDTAVSIDALSEDGTEHGFTLTVAADGKVSYDLSGANTESSTAGADRADVVSPRLSPADLTEESDSPVDEAPAPDGVEVAEVDAAGSPGECQDGAYSTLDRKEYGIYNWYLGDGAYPAAMTRLQALEYFESSIGRITSSHNNCGYADQVPAKSHYAGTTTYESDMGSNSTCTDRDGKSTWDAGNLATGTVAAVCAHTWPNPFAKNDLREADVRFNITDYDFTKNPTSSCNGRYHDVLNAGTHEAGHIFGLGHVGAGHSNLTMHHEAARCEVKKRTLGKGDVMGLRSIY
ncbi:zinc metalloprotease [Streptomyces chartreusis]|uniref:peptidase M10 n=1 Tax=Streptomyces chartreusis TaxID=1969 RepID=UPI003663E1E9